MPEMIRFRHGRACPGHPRLFLLVCSQDVDARHKAGHDGFKATHIPLAAF
jgi:hypothetical protein